MKFNYELTGAGWSVTKFDSGNGAVSITASYLSDALGNLASGAVLVMEGAERIEFSFDEEPGEFRWILRGIDPIRVELRILEFDDLWSKEPEERGKTVFEHTFERKEFAELVVGAMTELLAKYGERGYKEKWIEHDFPSREFSVLKSMVLGITPNQSKDPAA